MARSWDPTSASIANGSSINVNALIATTLPKVRPSIVDNFFDATPFMKFMRAKNRTFRWRGGATMEQPILYDENPYAKAYDPYEVLDVGPPQGFGTTVWKLATYRVPITYSRRAKAANSGKEAVVDMIQGFKDQAQRSLVNAINDDLMQETSSWTTKEIIPLNYMLEEAEIGSQSSVIGGIDKADYSSNALSEVWQNQYYNMDGGTAPQGLNAIRKVFYACSKGNDSPDIAICDTDSYMNLEDAIYEKVRFVNPGNTVDWGFENIPYKGCTFFFDKSLDDWSQGNTFFMNSKYLKLAIGDADFEVHPPKWDQSQDAYVGVIMVDLQLVCSNLSRQGVLANSDDSGNWD